MLVGSIKFAKSDFRFYKSQLQLFRLSSPSTFVFWTRQRKKSSSSAGTCDAICAISCSFSELWLIKKCLYINLLSPFHQLQLIIWVNCGTSYTTNCGIRPFCRKIFKQIRWWDHDRVKRQRPVR